MYILGIYNQFCPLDIQREIETKHNNHCLNSASFENYSTNLDIHSKNIPTIRTVKTINNYALLMLHLGKNATDNVNLKLFLTGKKKYLPTKYKVLGPKEINTGSTMMGINGTIKIWRKEELYKLILHEMIHFLNLDFKLISDEINENGFFTCDKALSENFINNIKNDVKDSGLSLNKNNVAGVYFTHGNQFFLTHMLAVSESFFNYVFGIINVFQNRF